MGTAELLAFSGSLPWGEECFYSLSRDGDSGTATAAAGMSSTQSVSIRCREMGTAEPANAVQSGTATKQVSIRCREMGTAEPRTGHPAPGYQPAAPFLFAVARWGQRNDQLNDLVHEPDQFLFAVARWGQRNPRLA